MTSGLAEKGYEIHPAVFNAVEIAEFQLEADRLARAEGSACVRHIRHKSAIFHRLAISPAVLGLIDPHWHPVRSILFDKTPDQNWPVPWHQDLTIAVENQEQVEGYGPWSFKDGVVHVQPPVEILRRMATIRIHLDPTPEENGALRVIPESHLLGKISSDSVAAYVNDSALTCECQPGDILLMSPLILHSSRKSGSPSRRRVVHFEYASLADLDPRLQWHENR